MVTHLDNYVSSLAVSQSSCDMPILADAQHFYMAAYMKLAESITYVSGCALGVQAVGTCNFQEQYAGAVWHSDHVALPAGQQYCQQHGSRHQGSSGGQDKAAPRGLLQLTWKASNLGQMLCCPPVSACIVHAASTATVNDARCCLQQHPHRSTSCMSRTDCAVAVQLDPECIVDDHLMAPLLLCTSATAVAPCCSTLPSHWVAQVSHAYSISVTSDAVFDTAVAVPGSNPKASSTYIQGQGDLAQRKVVHICHTVDDCAT